MLGEEGTLAAGQRIGLLLPDRELLLQLAHRVAAGVPGDNAPPPPPAPTLPVIAFDPTHLHPQRRDLLLGPDEGAEGPFGAAWIAFGLEAGRGHVREALDEVGQTAVEIAAGHDLLVLPKGPLHQFVDLVRPGVADQI